MAEHGAAPALGLELSEDAVSVCSQEVHPQHQAHCLLQSCDLPPSLRPITILGTLIGHETLCTIFHGRMDPLRTYVQYSRGLMQVKAAEKYRDEGASPEAKANAKYVQGKPCFMSHKRLSRKLPPSGRVTPTSALFRICWARRAHDVSMLLFQATFLNGATLQGLWMWPTTTRRPFSADS